jgi:transketolase
MRTAYINKLFALAKADPRVFAVISDNGAIIYDEFRRELPQQFINFGISEANMVGASAGMASCGKIPFAYTIGNFLVYRALEFIRNDVCLQNMNVKLVGIGAGLAYSTLGPTHNTTEDLAMLKAIPNLTVFSPASPLEVTKAVQAAYEINGPVYIRLETNNEKEIYKEDYIFETGKGVTLRDGNDLTIVCNGSITNSVLEVADEMKDYSIRVINIHTIKPFDDNIIVQAVKETGKIITIEEQNIIGGLGSSVADVIAQNGLSCRFIKMGLKDCFGKGYGTREEVRNYNGLGKQDIRRMIKSV